MTKNGARFDNAATMALTILIILLLAMGPIGWVHNEVHYFQLGIRIVRPDLYTENHAAFDNTLARIASLRILGILVQLFGLDGGMIAARLIAIAAFAVSLAYLARSWTLTTVETALALIVFLLLGQKYIADEWLFGGVEGKVFAYAAIFAAIGLICRDKIGLAFSFAALATYFHFLVGGFWACAALLLLGLRTGQPALIGRGLLIYVSLCAPLLAILVYEWLLLPAPDIADLGTTVSRIYSEFRVPHHVAPFIELSRWLPGINWILAATCTLSLLAIYSNRLQARTRWLLALHVYLLSALGLAYLDRHTHHLGLLYLFRPNSLILLLSLMLAALSLREAMSANAPRALAAALLLTAIPFAAERAWAIRWALMAPQLPLISQLEPDERNLVDWVKRNTPTSATVVVEPARETDWRARWQAFEYFTGRPTLANFKFVPSQKIDLIRWYRLILWKRAVFAGDCSRLAEFAADYLVSVAPGSKERLATCAKPVWSSGSLTVFKVTSHTNESAPEG